MDLLYKRYANPFELLDQMILCGRFSEFVSEFIKLKNQETEEESLWEYYLHYPFIDMSFEDFKRQLEIGNDEPQAKPNLETTVRQSMNILGGFVPDDIEEN